MSEASRSQTGEIIDALDRIDLSDGSINNLVGLLTKPSTPDVAVYRKPDLTKLRQAEDDMRRQGQRFQEQSRYDLRGQI